MEYTKFLSIIQELQDNINDGGVINNVFLKRYDIPDLIKEYLKNNFNIVKKIIDIYNNKTEISLEPLFENYPSKIDEIEKIHKDLSEYFKLHIWSRKDDLIGYYCYKFYSKDINKIKELSIKYDIPFNSLKMKIQNFASIENKTNLIHISEQSRDIYNKYNNKSQEFINFLLENNIKAVLRQNQWQKACGVFDTIKYTKKIICPSGHTKDICESYNRGEYSAIKYNPNVFINKLNINDKLLLIDREEKQHSLLIEIKSGIKSGIISDLKILRKRHCHHIPILYGCDSCNESVEKIFSTEYYKKNITEFTQYLNEDYIIENMWCLYRDISIVKEINNDNQFYHNYKTLRTSIRYIDL